MFSKASSVRERERGGGEGGRKKGYRMLPRLSNAFHFAYQGQTTLLPTLARAAAGKYNKMHSSKWNRGWGGVKEKMGKAEHEFN